MKILVVILIMLFLAILGLLTVIALRGGRRGYQKYSGLQRQRGSAKQTRMAGYDRLMSAERHLVEAQREMSGRGEHGGAQEIEKLRVPLSTLADRLRSAEYGYTPLGSDNPVREAELAEIQARDADIMTETETISNLTREIRDQSRDAQVPDLRTLATALDHLRESLDRRRKVN